MKVALNRQMYRALKRSSHVVHVTGKPWSWLKIGREWRRVEVLLPMLFIASVVILPRLTLHYEHPFMAVASSSMRPALEVGDLIAVKYCSITDVSVGDIIVYRAPDGEMIVHRVVEVYREEGFVRTKGDANLVADPWKIYEKNIVGKVVFRFPLVGYVALNPYVKFCIAATATGMLAFIAINILVHKVKVPDQQTRGNLQLSPLNG